MTQKTVDALLPVRGRASETLALLPRLFNVSEYQYSLTIIVDSDPKLYEALVPVVNGKVVLNEKRQGYWKCLRQAAQYTDNYFIVNLANDLLPGRGWLKRAVDAHQSIFQDGEGMIGFNDGVHFGEHAAHFLINRSMLYRWYDDDYFPVMYDHAWGDSEMTRRAIEEGKFAVANFAILFHNHPYNGKAMDPVYEEGFRKYEEDKRLFYDRMERHWT